jgi:hypothetical protein
LDKTRGKHTELLIFDKFKDFKFRKYLEWAISSDKKEDKYIQTASFEEILKIFEWMTQNKGRSIGVKHNMDYVIRDISVRFIFPDELILNKVDECCELIEKTAICDRRQIIIPKNKINKKINKINPNHLSVVCVILWGKIKLILCADAENIVWRKYVRDNKSEAKSYMTKACLIKIGHHGSLSGYNNNLYGNIINSPNTIGVLTPFNRGKDKLPQKDALNKMGKQIGKIYTTSMKASSHSGRWDGVRHDEIPPEIIANKVVATGSDDIAEYSYAPNKKILDAIMINPEILSHIDPSVISTYIAKLSGGGLKIEKSNIVSHYINKETGIIQYFECGDLAGCLIKDR